MSSDVVAEALVAQCQLAMLRLPRAAPRTRLQRSKNGASDYHNNTMGTKMISLPATVTLVPASAPGMRHRMRYATKNTARMTEI